MSPKLPRLTARQVVRALERGGWVFIRKTGSHAHYRNPMRGSLTTVPEHTSKTLPEFILASILRQSGLTVDELLELLG